MALVSFKDVSLAYDGQTVVSGLTFEVNSGDYLCVVGENGSGKSTMMKALLGLIKSSGGSISFGDGLVQNEIGYLPQQSQIQRDFPASIFEVVVSGVLNRPGLRMLYTREERELAREKMRMLGLEGMEHRCYNELSGGQQQRVLLARALCATRKLLLLDEPVSGLDPVVTDEMYSIIRTLNREHGITIIMISHDVAAVTADATHVLHLNHRPEFFGKAEDYFRSSAARKFLPASAIE